MRGNGCTLPEDWFKLVEITPASEMFKPVGNGRDFKNSRREIEDAAAVAFGKLPAERRAEFLASSGAAPEPEPKKKPGRKRKRS